MTDEPEPRRAVVDRIVDDLAVVLVDPDEQEHHVPADHLPPGTGEGTWVLVTGSGADLQVVGVDTRGEAAHRADTEERLARLRRTRRSGRFRPGR